MSATPRTAPAPPGATDPASTPWDSAHRRLTTGMLLLVAATAFEALAVATIMPITAAELGGIELYGWAFSAFLLANLVGIVFSGSIADRSGPVAPFALGVVVLTVGLVLGGVAGSMGVLILARVLQGFAGGCVSAVAYVAIGRGYPASARPKMLALLSSAWVVPGLVGPAISGLITDQFGWRWVFLALVPLPPLAAALALPALRRLPAGEPTASAVERVRYALQLAIGAGMLLAGLGWRDALRLPGGAGLTLPGPVLAVALVVAGGLIALPALRYLLPAGALRAAPGLPAAVATMALLNLGFFGVDAFVPLGLIELRQQSILFASLALTGATLTWTAGSWIQARLAATASRRRMAFSGLCFLVAGCVLFLPVLWPAVPVLIGPVAWTVAGLGMGLAYATLSLVVLETAPTGQEGAASASLQLATMIGSGIGTGVGGAVISAAGDAGSLHLPLVVQIVVMIGVLLLALVTTARLPGAPIPARPVPDPSRVEPQPA